MGIMDTSALTSWLQIMACPGKYLVLDQFNSAFTYFIFAKISFTIDHKLREPVGMHSEQIDQLLSFHFSVQVHIRYFNNYFYKHYATLYINILKKIKNFSAANRRKFFYNR